MSLESEEMLMNYRFAPRKHRARMLAFVFYMQPVGQLCANIVAISATAISRKSTILNANPSNCVGECMQTTDKIWRWIVGLGAVVPTLALLARLLIPESPRYLLEVEKDSHTAQQNAKNYFTEFEDPFQDPGEEDFTVFETAGAGADPHAPRGMPGNHDPTQVIVMEQMSRNHVEQHHHNQPLNNTGGHSAVLPEGGLETIETYPSPSAKFTGATETTLNGSSTISSVGSPRKKEQMIVDTNSAVPSTNLKVQYDNDIEQFRLPPPEQPAPNPGINFDILEALLPTEENSRTRKATWKEFLHGFREFLFNPNWINSSATNSDDDAPFDPDARHRWTDGNWTDLFGTSASWFLLDFSCEFIPPH